ncbi:hypothetical protein BJ085DRAFT_18762 [Dimargaris cristalligena]|uniref:Ras-GAP domain-containing protein n=1 Tax=Dimargaris cristalligena TaxID=215637 RepID=A0A4P9ZXQ9_9FUNG|nr:hypothetical protein BJ085DRAFT_18762 [Dimargaris cristalligena]|eukprot:RKP38437.1 hypothetical protein BJ085DRAFT_18762 [Dimargaris cristalligena]
MVANLDQSRAFYLSTARSYLFLTGSLASTFVPSIDSITGLIFSTPRKESRVNQTTIANRILFYLSASNWNVVFSRIKTRMQSLASTQDEFTDIQELRILEYCHLNTQRISHVFQELSIHFLQFRRNVQLAVAPTLRRMIWNWIESYPADYIALWKEGRRLDGNPEILFDVCLSLHDNNHPKGKVILWPLQATLLALCPDVLTMLVNFEGGSKAAKRRVFLDNLSKAMRNSRNFEAAAHAYVDFIRAASYVSLIENTALNTIVSDFEPSLRERLFDFRSPNLDPANNIDQRFLMESLIAYYRYDPYLTVNRLVPLFFQEGISAAYRLVLVKACYSLAIEPTLPWLPSISVLYSHVASSFRKLFQSYVTQPLGWTDPAVRKSSLSLERALLKRSNKGSDAETLKTERIEFILTLLKAYWTDPLPAIYNSNPELQFSENLTLFNNITACFREPVTTIRSMAAFTVLSLHDAVYIEKWGPEGMMMKSFWTISSQVLLAVAREILDFNDREEGVKFMLYILLRLLAKRNQFIQKYPSQVAQGIEVHDRLVASVAMEIALLVLLCSAEPSIINMAQDCFAYLCDEAVLTEEVDDPHHSNFTIVKNYAVYRELSKNNTIITGKVAQQKRIRRLLRQMTTPTMGNLAAWEEGYKRWRVLIQGVSKGLDHDDDGASNVGGDGSRLGNSGGSSSYSKANHLHHLSISSATSSFEEPRVEDRGEWPNYTGFLCALGGVCLQGSGVEANPVASSASALASNTSLAAVSNMATGQVDAPQMLNRFMQELVDLLVSDNILVRETIKDILGTDLSPALFALLLSHLQKVVNRFVMPDGDIQCTDHCTLFVGQAISVVKMILERMNEPTVSLFTVDLGGLVFSFARYLHRLGNSPTALQMKIRMCQLTEILMQKKEYLSLRHEIKFRNKLLDIIISWTSDFTSKVSESHHQSHGSVSGRDNEKLHRELDQDCMKTVVSLLLGLPLQPQDNVVESELGTVKSHQFYRYFSFFIKLLNRCRVLEILESGAHRTKLTQDLQNLLAQSKEYIKDLRPLKEYTILALSNLLSANVESGLKYSLTMGYHEDTRIRTSFMQVLTNILNQGTEFESLTDISLVEKQEKLLDIILEPDMAVALALCDACPVADIDELSMVLLSVFESRGLAIPLLKGVTERELYKTESAPEMFRRNCIATRLLSLFAKVYGFEYLRETLQSLIHDVIKRAHDAGPGFSYELDPTKLSATANTNQNLQHLIELCNRLLDAITSSICMVPDEFRDFCHFLVEVVNARFPGSQATAVGGFIFLRFFCPSIVAPDSHDLVKGNVNKEVRRGLILATKVIQNLANDVLFGAKEAFMTPLNDFLITNKYKVTQYLEELGQRPSDAYFERGMVKKHADPNDVARLHRFVSENLDRIGRDMISIKQIKTMGIYPTTRTTLEPLYDQLCTLLSQLGKPPEVVKSENVIAAVKGGASTELYREFMLRNSHRNADQIKAKKLFYEGGVSKEKRPVVYFIARRLITDATDMDLLMLHVFQTLEPLMKKPFELLMDLTQFGHANEIQHQWIGQFSQLLPAQLTQNLHTVYMYNVNTAFKHYSKRLLSAVPLKLPKRIVFPFNLNDLYAYINPADLDLPKGTVSLETDTGVNISPVSRIFHMKAAMPTIIKITNEAIQITSLKKQEVCGLSSYFNDVYHISEVDDISLVTSPRRDETLVVVKFDRGNTSMTFSSPKYEFIYKAIRSTRARFQSSKPSTMSERLIRPNDVPGTLLNMALLNSGSDDPNLRLTAYNLLYALSLNFNFDVGNLLFNAAGLCIPANNTNFIISISHKIAACEPRFTLEFLTECFMGFSKSSTPLKHLCLEYMAPWLPNLALFCKRGADHTSGQYKSSLSKTVEVIKVLIELTVRESEMYPSVQAKIWRKIGRAEELLDVVLSFFVQYAVECGPFSTQAEVIANTIVTLAAVNVRTAKLISRLRKLLVHTSVSPARSLLEHPSWSEIAVLIRFSLMLMYNNPAAAQQYLPEIFFNLTMVIGIGPSSIRTSVHGLVINVIQSLVASVSMDKGDLKDLNSLVTQFSEPRFRLMFGLHRMSGNSAAIHGTGGDVDLPESTSLVSLETIIQSLLSIVDCKTFAADVANAWRARWMSLVTSTAFQYNLAIQPRAFIMLGCLASDEVDDDLLYQVLVTLRGALEAFDEKDTNLILSIVLCLTKLVNKLSTDSQFLPTLFWLALAIIQIGHVNLFSSGLALLEEILRSLDTQGIFVEITPYEYLLASRESFEQTMGTIDSHNGVNFYTDFSFALATLLIKGLHHPASKGTVLNFLHTFIGVHTNRGGPGTAQKQITFQVLGAVVPLLPMAAKNGELGELLWQLGLGDLRVDNCMPMQNCYRHILNRFETPTETSAILLASFLVVMLNLSQYEGEQLFLYGFLSEVATAFPDTFSLVYHTLLPKMNTALMSSQHLPTLEAIQSILISVNSAMSMTSSGMSIKSDSSSGRISHEEKLHELGFSGLMDTTTFETITPATMRRNATLASHLVDRIVS